MLGYFDTSQDHTDETMLGMYICTDIYTYELLCNHKSGMQSKVCVSVSSFKRVFSDVYVFGIGEQLKKDQLNALASKKRDEQHVFILKNYETLGEVFNSIISE